MWWSLLVSWNQRVMRFYNLFQYMHIKLYRNACQIVIYSIVLQANVGRCGSMCILLHRTMLESSCDFEMINALWWHQLLTQKLHNEIHFYVLIHVYADIKWGRITVSFLNWRLPWEYRAVVSILENGDNLTGERKRAKWIPIYSLQYRIHGN